jgi:septal ring factor EnvC (AmiA/AmiB activator)
VKQLRDTIAEHEHALAEARKAIKTIEQSRKEDDEKTAKIKALLVKTKKELTEARQSVTDYEATVAELRSQVCLCQRAQAFV